MKYKFFAHILKNPISIEDAIQKFDSSQSSVYRWVQELKSEGLNIAYNREGKVYIKTEKNYRKCTHCRKELPIVEFYKNKHSKGGYLTHCKKCDLIYFSEVDRKKIKRIKEYRKSLKITSLEAAKIIGISQGYLSLLESGRQVIPEKTYKKIIKAYENYRT